MSASEDSQAAYTRLRDLLRGLVYVPAAITTLPDAIKQVKKILRIGKPFEPLLVNPFTRAGDVPRISSVLEIRNVLDVFDALEPVTKLDDSLTAALSDSITASLQKYSAPIADWLEYILPSRGYVRLQPMDYALVLPPIGRILVVLFHYKSTVSKALSELPHLYMTLFRLWFHLEPSLACLPQEHARDLYRCTEFAMRNAVRSPQYLQSSVSNPLDIQATDCALAVVKHHPRRFYKYAVRCIPRLIESCIEQNFVEARLNTIMLYAAGALKPQAYPRDVVISITEVLRAQQEAPGGHVAAVYAFQILFAIWVISERLLADLARLDSMPPPPFKPEFYRVDIDFEDIMPCHQISAHPPDLHQFAEL
ncbi:uncharacterized protein SCHCODRAFT_02597253 [Schizophyllum commune H4-8]|uniref:Uncharacterized protein n=1 Tax=Schizophyllum commune (strain H4-8 / FGSC 9210) TaxID=578458 RepID=D8PYJ7_SCHCM|nr:uncharacterized protein SCHCODRAFT_02597253 [Schizophyllum commune H4-8]KAI5895994.1 hypothetical protein SCHCODRAFT_02597253 [Schizophyllum commune H4-8]